MKRKTVKRFDSDIKRASKALLHDNKSCSDDGTSMQSFDDETFINQMTGPKLKLIQRRKSNEFRKEQMNQVLDDVFEIKSTTSGTTETEEEKP